MRLWTTGVSLVASHNTRGPQSVEVASESLTEQVELSTPPQADHAVAVLRALPDFTASITHLSPEPAARSHEPDDTGPPLEAAVSIHNRRARLRPPRRVSRSRAPALLVSRLI